MDRVKKHLPFYCQIWFLILLLIVSIVILCLGNILFIVPLMAISALVTYRVCWQKEQTLKEKINQYQADISALTIRVSELEGTSSPDKTELILLRRELDEAKEKIRQQEDILENARVRSSHVGETLS